jgi:hypothetical protein
VRKTQRGLRQKLEDVECARQVKIHVEQQSGSPEKINKFQLLNGLGGECYALKRSDMDNDGFLPVTRQEQELLMTPGREEVASLGHLEKYRSTNRYITVLR